MATVGVIGLSQVNQSSGTVAHMLVIVYRLTQSSTIVAVNI